MSKEITYNSVNLMNILRGCDSSLSMKHLEHKISSYYNQIYQEKLNEIVKDIEYVKYKDSISSYRELNDAFLYLDSVQEIIELAKESLRSQNVAIDGYKWKRRLLKKGKLDLDSIEKIKTAIDMFPKNIVDNKRPYTNITDSNPFLMFHPNCKYDSDFDPKKVWEQMKKEGYDTVYEFIEKTSEYYYVTNIKVEELLRYIDKQYRIAQIRKERFRYFRHSLFRNIIPVFFLSIGILILTVMAYNWMYFNGEPLFWGFIGRYLLIVVLGSGSLSILFFFIFRNMKVCNSNVGTINYFISLILYSAIIFLLAYYENALSFGRIIAYLVVLIGIIFLYKISYQLVDDFIVENLTVGNIISLLILSGVFAMSILYADYLGYTIFNIVLSFALIGIVGFFLRDL